MSLSPTHARPQRRRHLTLYLGESDCDNTTQLHLYAHDVATIRWLHHHGKELSKGFKETHGERHRASFPPHGLGVVLFPMTTEATFDPSRQDEEPVYVAVSCHDDQGHVEPTREDLRRAFEQLGMSLSVFTGSLRP